ncbi:MAG: hypothetical protein CVU55_01855 [Deltaproteobacteria bacterium HGW-Deltaproteobacteria-13]|jgi:hypothetical protein|nr:MAG: hypothetical protein CVU55_01855 [Deltaproteobacteria bacterium HGW-Deltaproteobacteria-13]
MLNAYGQKYNFFLSKCQYLFALTFCFLLSRFFKVIAVGLKKTSAALYFLNRLYNNTSKLSIDERPRVSLTAAGLSAVGNFVQYPLTFARGVAGNARKFLHDTNKLELNLIDLKPKGKGI